MQCYTELTPPTAVTHSLSLPFLSSTANNLIVVKTSLLQVFSLKSIVATTDDAPASQAPGGLANGKEQIPTAVRAERVQTTKLVLIAEYELAGTVTSVAKVKLLRSKSGGDALLVAIRDAKLSLVEWDPECHSISTVSIHYYEREDILPSPWDPDLTKCGTILSVDPSSRCAVFKFGARHIAILPFHQLGDDIALDEDDELDGGKLERKISLSKQTGDDSKKKTPYAASFVLSLLALDPTLKHPIHLSFLYEYREPTFGILSSETTTSTSLLANRKDNVTYAVYNLDLEQRASTSLLSVTHLPYDLFEVVPLSKIIGGALLVGSNEIIHVDPSGKTNGVAVNEAAKHCTSFPLADQADLKLRLEHCMIKQLGYDSPELLLIEDQGALLILSFKIDGRSVSGLSLHRLSLDDSPLLTGASSATIIGRGRMFLGSEDADSVVLGWSRSSDRLKRKPSRVDLVTEKELSPEFDDIDIEDDDDDDLYAEDKPSDAVGLADNLKSDNPESEFKFRVHDSLLNTGPLTDITLGRTLSSTTDDFVPDQRDELLATVSRGKAGSLMSFQRYLGIRPTSQHDISGAKSLWAFPAKPAQEVSTTNAYSFDEYLIAAFGETDGVSKSSVYKFSDGALHEVRGTEFDSDAGAAIECGILNDGNRIVQVLSTEVRTFDTDFGLAQMYPLGDEDTELEAKVQTATFADPYVLLTKDDESLTILVADESGDLDEISQGEKFQQTKWTAGSLYEDVNDALRLEYGDDDEESSNVLAFLLSVKGGLQLRTFEDDVVVYQPYQAQIEGDKDTALRFLKLPNAHFAAPIDEDEMEDDFIKPQHSFRVLNDVQGYSAVSISGSTPSFILKTASSPLRIIHLTQRDLTSIIPLNLPNCRSGFAFISNNDRIITAQLNPQNDYTTGFVTQRIPLQAPCNALAYHAPQKAYILSTLTRMPFKLPDDEALRISPPEDEPVLPILDQSTLQLFDRPTTSTISTYELDPWEVVLCISVVNLETSEITHERADLVCVGTGVIRGEDLGMIGHIYVLAIIDVVPDPEHPETGRAFKLIAKEETKGAVTSLSSVGTQGFLMSTHGQKTLVRGLKEDGSLLPVAFMDMQIFPTMVRELPGTGLCVIGDALQKVWFGGYTEDPYQLRLFAKSPYPIETVTVSFLPDGKNLYIVAIDTDGSIHVLQYDPERTSLIPLGHQPPPPPPPPFHTPHYPATTTLLSPSPSPITNTSSPNKNINPNPLNFPPHSLLLTSPTGSLALLTPLPASSHRTLSALQNHLISTLSHPLGLNPRAFRAGGEQGNPRDRRGLGMGGSFGGMAGTSCVLDGMVLRRWLELGTWRRWGGEDARVVRGMVRGALGVV
ncbi:uncharacterized protein KY384_008543 [Bacidia gigantensis]|uniref:uncharacterized protein n=1 Tax=Bacidia gigantensis TaxID=2732470 RepID=UPI001D05ABBA|nr:uncharacterized protein KY384_008543 [Bacidia gigantensis]KAG8527114.1 hypothetical protein KY384_008543 [Bacidia gigantensis]